MRSPETSTAFVRPASAAASSTALTAAPAAATRIDGRTLHLGPTPVPARKQDGDRLVLDLQAALDATFAQGGVRRDVVQRLLLAL
ncbi:hypothetical protein [Amnibacterium endophyticum]|uniref:Uncharacterized protein n=1 Tax=Amnibacterium endophyticum TaxID=2109337 RepID=A0ABW4LFU9_9MICO